LDDDDDDSMALDPAVAESSGGDNSRASRRTSVHVPTYIGADDGGPLPSQTWDAPDQTGPDFIGLS
jgi:hypothetical protein